MTLTEFLLARVAEDEAVAVGSAPSPWGALNAAGYGRILVECGAKRLLIERVGNPDWAGFNILALPYADHPDYQQEWKP